MIDIACMLLFTSDVAAPTVIHWSKLKSLCFRKLFLVGTFLSSVEKKLSPLSLFDHHCRALF